MFLLFCKVLAAGTELGWHQVNQLISSAFALWLPCFTTTTTKKRTSRNWTSWRSLPVASADCRWLDICLCWRVVFSLRQAVGYDMVKRAGARTSASGKFWFTRCYNTVLEGNWAALHPGEQSANGLKIFWGSVAKILVKMKWRWVRICFRHSHEHDCPLVKQVEAIIN